MTTNDGGPAFPMGYHRDGNSADHGGMSLRDWFASQATEADVANWINIMLANGSTASREEAKYLYADAMLRAREGGR